MSKDRKFIGEWKKKKKTKRNRSRGGCGGRGGGKKPIDLKKKLTPEAIQESCEGICSEAIKEYPKVLEIKAKLIGKIDKKKKTKLVKKFTKECQSNCEKTLHEAKEILPMMDKLQKQKDKKTNKDKKNKKKTKKK